ncbi:MAG: DNA polymerase III subunit beta [Actinobacteria bacterium]|nr:DNA polymerase III subunit beta [Actinomycetota bacterium]MCG2818370.1 DNA polymerase III subunit beta [Actinomycetes bacterium]MBU4219908.1 DNA polymerase III subunit beta [Actinomycetota bacterium]MBU4360059.1 DNA polymerase III subunit beta [Actinomycetota bacterium]MBU4391456.1 DNA polymerase III subunit beta [Actinomycetota bacterium]
MIVSCKKEGINSIVQSALRGISSKVTIPILTGVLINAERNRLVISSTDLEMSVRAEMDAEVPESGATVVSGRLMGDILKNLRSADVKIESSEKYLTVKSDEGEYRIREMMPEDFPKIPQWEGELVLKAGGGEFLMAVQQTSKASSSDEKRPVLTGTLLEKEVGDGKIRMVSTDSYRLALKELEVTGELTKWEDCIIPTRALNEVARLAGSSDADVEIKMQDKQMMFRVDNLVVSSRLIEGQFPNYRQLLPKGEKTKVKVDREEIIAAIKRSLIFGHNLRFGVYGDHVRITTETPEVGDSKEEVAAEVEGEELEIGFNGVYMMDGVTAVESEKVEIRMDEAQKPAVLGNDGSASYKYVLMPVRLR